MTGLEFWGASATLVWRIGELFRCRGQARFMTALANGSIGRDTLEYGDLTGKRQLHLWFRNPLP